MPSIQVDYNNAQFAQFLQFAGASDGKEIARLGATDTLGTRTITAHKGDSVHAFHRSAEAKIHNDAARTAFRNAIVDMFGGERNIPENVRKAMLLSDYGKGKPLTARRILAVKAEIDKVVAAATGKCEARLAELGRNVDATSKALVREALQECHCDKDLLDIVTRNIDRFVLNTGGLPRTAQAVRSKVAALATCFAELRQAANGNEGVIAAGRRFFSNLQGAALPQGMVRALVEAVPAMEVGHITALSPDSSEIDIHRAVIQFTDNAAAAMASSGADAALPGSLERNLCRKFLGEMMVLRGGEGALARAKAALETESASKLATFCTDLSNDLPANAADYEFRTAGGAMSRTSALGAGERLYVMDSAHAEPSEMDQLKGVLDEACGLPKEGDHSVPLLRNPVRAQDIPGNAEIVGDAVERGRAEMDLSTRGFLGGVVRGGGPGATVIRDIFAVRTEQMRPYRPHDAMMHVCEGGIGPRIARSVADEAARLAGGTVEAAKSYFLNAVARGTTILLPDEKPLSGDPDQAFDQFAGLVTKGAKTHFNALNATERNKVFVAIALVTRNVGPATFTGLAEALDPRANPGNAAKPTFLLDSDPATDTQAMHLKWDSNGFSVQYEFHRDVVRLRIPAAPDTARIVNEPPPPPEPEPEPPPPIQPRRPGAPQQPGIISSILANHPRPEPRPEAAPPPAPPEPFTTIHTGPGSVMECHFKFSIGEAEFNRMATAGDFQIGGAEGACNYFHFSASIN